MGGRPAFMVVLLLIVALSMVAESSLSSHLDGGAVTAFAGDNSNDGLIDLSESRIGDALSEDEEMMMPSESARRTLQSDYGKISYEAMLRNRIPCDRRGRSYYQCTRMRSARTYRRGCNKISRCERGRPS